MTLTHKHGRGRFFSSFGLSIDLHLQTIQCSADQSKPQEKQGSRHQTARTKISQPVVNAKADAASTALLLALHQRVPGMQLHRVRGPGVIE